MRTVKAPIRVLVALLVALVGVPAASAEEHPPHPDTLPSFNESGGCDALQGARGPLASKSGTLSFSEPIYGPWGDFYGRTVGEVHSQLVVVHLPGLSKDLYIHQRILPAFELVLDNLAAAAAQGKTYNISYYTWSWNNITIPPTRKLSFHTVGAALDVNSHTNPYRADNVLVTDMPAWFVEAWTSVGWCWGGNWQTIKDAMHYSWKGPLYTPGYVMPPPQPPDVAAADFTSQVDLHVGHEAVAGDPHFVADMDRDGAVDVVRLVANDNGTVSLVSAAARYDHRHTVVAATTATAPGDPAAPSALVDITSDGRPDLIYVTDSGGNVELEVFPFAFSALAPQAISTSVPAAAGSTYLFDDYDRNGETDLVVVRPGEPGTVELWLGPDFATVAATQTLGVGSADHRFTLGDRDVDGIPDLFALGPDGTLVVYGGGSGFADSSSIETGVDPTGETLFAADLDGDGHSDLMLVGADGSTRLRRGGASTHPPGIWYVESVYAIERYGGSDRYETAAATSAAEFPDPAAVDTVFIATGANFPDGLAGSAIAGRLGAPLLLVNPNSLPTATANELARLDPDTVVILGGTSAVSPSVAKALGVYGTTVRLSGPDRYATAVAISRYGFPTDGSAEQVVVATGADFADALAGAPVASRFNGPVLLTEPNGLADVTRGEIERLDPDRIVVLGGTGVVSAAVFDQLAALAPTVRVAGANRYETAVKAGREAFPGGAGELFVTTGLNFPDALAGAAAAAAAGAPILLVPGTSLPGTVGDEIERLAPGTVILLGGTAVISSTVESAIGLLGY